MGWAHKSKMLASIPAEKNGPTLNSQAVGGVFRLVLPRIKAFFSCGFSLIDEKLWSLKHYHVSELKFSEDT